MMIKNLKKQIEKVLRTEPDTRNSDITLLIRIWQLNGVEESVSLNRLYDLPREDNIKRIRAKFCEMGKPWAYPTSYEVAKRRGIREEKWRQMLGYPRGVDTYYPTRKESYIGPVIPPQTFPKSKEGQARIQQLEL